jgi:hypothetical protein
MIRLRLLSAAAAALALEASPALGGESPSFVCAEGSGAAYQIYLGEDVNRLLVRDHGRSRAIALSGANIGRPDIPGLPLVFDGWNRAGEDLYTMLQPSTEIVVEYRSLKGRPYVRLSLAVDHRERRGLTCKSVGFSTSVIPADRELTAPQRFAVAFALAASLRSREGNLTPAGVLALEAAYRRLGNAPEFATDTSRTAIVLAIAPSLKKVEPLSLSRVASRLPPALAASWRAMLNQIQYRYYPSVARYAAWIEDGSRDSAHRDLDSVYAGFKGFVTSSGYRDKDIRAYFVSEIKPSLKGLREPEVARVRALLDPDAQGFLTQVWTEAIGRRTLADYPEAQRLAREIAGLVEGRNFDPRQVEGKIAAFLRSNLAKDRQARASFVLAASHPLKRLNARQREDLLGWMENPGEKWLVMEILR